MIKSTTYSLIDKLFNDHSKPNHKTSQSKTVNLTYNLYVHLPFKNIK